MLLGVTNGGVNAFASRMRQRKRDPRVQQALHLRRRNDGPTATFNPSAIPGTITIALYGQGGNGQPAASATLGGQSGAPGRSVL